MAKEKATKLTEFPMAWASISGQELHDAGGREGIGNLIISLETSLMYGRNVREPMDFIVVAVPTTRRDQLEKFLRDRFGGHQLGRTHN